MTFPGSFPIPAQAKRQRFRKGGKFYPKQDANWYLVDIRSGACGGCSNTAISGSVPGSPGGGRYQILIPANLVTAPVDVIVGAGGPGSVGGTPNLGSSGGDSSFVGFCTVKGALITSAASQDGGGIFISPNVSGLSPGAGGVGACIRSNASALPAEWGGATGPSNGSLPGAGSVFGGPSSASSSSAGTATGGAAGTASLGTGVAAVSAAGVVVGNAGPDGVNGRCGDAGGLAISTDNTQAIGGAGGFPSAAGGPGIGGASATGGKGGDGVVDVYWF